MKFKPRYFSFAARGLGLANAPRGTEGEQHWKEEEMTLPDAGWLLRGQLTTAGCLATLRRPRGYAPSIPLRCTAKDPALIVPEFLLHPWPVVCMKLLSTRCRGEPGGAGNPPTAQAVRPQQEGVCTYTANSLGRKLQPTLSFA